MKKIFIFLMVFFSFFILSGCGGGSGSSSSDDYFGAVDDVTNNDSGTTDPGTNDPGTTTPVITGNVDPYEADYIGFNYDSSGYIQGSTLSFTGDLGSPFLSDNVWVTRNFASVAFFNNQYKQHLGVDIAADSGEALYSPVDGQVVAILTVNGYGADGILTGESDVRPGRVILIQAGDVVVFLGHVSPLITLHIGDQVALGQILGAIDSYNHVENGVVVEEWPHLHLGMRLGIYSNDDYAKFIAGYSNSIEKSINNGGYWVNPLFYVANDTQQSSLHVLSPNGGEIFYRDQVSPIRWESENVTGNVRIHLYRNGALFKTLPVDVPNTGGVGFSPSVDIPSGPGYSIAVSDLEGKIYDFSDQYFSIQDSPYTTGVYPAPPTDLGLGTSPGLNFIILTWQGVGGADGYQIYWETSPGVTHESNALPLTTKTYYTHNGVGSGSCYYYRVASVQNGVISNYLSTESYICK